MATFRFIGDWAQHQNTFFTKFGQTYEASPADALALAKQGVALIPDSDFHFTPEECDKYPTALARNEAPPDFQAKMLAALETLADFRSK